MARASTGGPVSEAGGFLLALAVGAAGGLAMFDLNAPLPWLLGAMIACSAAAIAGLPVTTPSIARPPMTALIGTMLGTSFTANTFAGAGAWIVPLAGLMVFLALAGAAGYLIMRWVGGFDRPTAYFAGMPGGLVEMTALGRDFGGDERVIALAHGARIFFVVLSLPFLLELLLGVDLPRSSAVPVPFSAIALDQALWFAVTFLGGMLLARYVALPARYMFGPLIVSAGVHLTGLSDFVLPSGLVATAQVIIGAVIGCRFAGIEKRTVIRGMALSVVTTTALFVVTFGFSGLISMATGEAYANIVLAYSPGGLAEMSLIALALSGEVAFVVMHHVVRVAMVVTVSTWVFKCWTGQRPSGV